MRRNRRQKPNKYASKLISFAAFALALMFSLPSTAIDEDSPLTIKPSILWVSDDLSLSILDDTQYNSFLGSGEIWYNKWGVSTKLIENHSSDIFSLPTDSEYFNLDVKRRFGSQNNFNFELGLGWQEISIDSQLDASGPRLSLSGNYKVFKSFQLYGSTSYLPELNASINDNTATAYEVEAGFLYSPQPFFSLKAGYRVFDLELGDPNIDNLGSTSVFLFGSDWSW